MGSYGCNKEYNKIIKINEDSGEWYMEIAKLMREKKDEKDYIWNCFYTPLEIRKMKLQKINQNV